MGIHSLIRSKAGGAQRRGGKSDRGEPRSGGKIPHHDAVETAEKEVVQYVDQAALTIQVEAQLVDLQRLKADVGRALKLQADGPGRIVGLYRGLQAAGCTPFRGGDGQRPQRCVVTGAEGAGNSTYRL